MHRSQATKSKSPPPQKIQELTNREVAFHLGNVKRTFDGVIYLEYNVFNTDESHFALNRNDVRTLAIKGNTEVKFADFVRGDVGLTMIIMAARGSRAQFEIPLMIF